MAKKFEERLEAVRDAVASPKTPAARKLLTSTLRGQHGFLISVAASAAVEDEELRQEAPAAFERLCVDPIKRDPQCHGKVAIARAFYDAEIRAPEVFTRGVRHVQLEPVLGGRQDTAAELRGICLLALVHGHHPRALVYAAERLADPERAARLAAVRALAASNRPDVAEPLLTLRIESGEPDAEVATDCLTELLRLDAEANLEAVVLRLRDRDLGVAEAAALALGATRAPGALDALRVAADDTVELERRRTLFLALAMLRSDGAWACLVEYVTDASVAVAGDALDALATFRDHPGVRELVEAAIDERNDEALRKQFESAFEP